jgi:hypothetical protein
VAIADTAEVTCTINGKTYHGKSDCLQQLTLATREQPNAATALAAAPKSATVPKQLTSRKAPKPVVNVFLRKSFEDLKSLSEPSQIEEATGATFSWSDDRVAGNKNWTAQALLGFSVSGTGLPAYTPYISESFTGMYAQIDRQLNSKDITKNVDDWTFGGRHEFVLANWASTSHYVGFAGEVVTDSNGVAKNWDFTADYTPFGTDPGTGSRPLISYANWPIDSFKYVLVTFGPKLKAEYRGSLEGSNDPLFQDHKNVLRVGGSVGMTVAPSLFYAATGDLPLIISRSLLNVSYSWLYDTMSQRQADYFDTAYTFHLTESRNVGITFNYRHGLLETTGKRIDLYKVALSAKFDYDPAVPSK